MKDIFDEKIRANLEERVRGLRPDSRRQWGRMSPHEAICHMSDAFRMALAEKPVAPGRGVFRPLVRFVALHLPMKWPQGIRTLAETEQGRGGTPPVAFEADRTELLRLIRRFCAARPHDLSPTHPMFGDMTAKEWGRWAYRHLDHHLRQFGV